MVVIAVGDPDLRSRRAPARVDLRHRPRRDPPGPRLLPGDVRARDGRRAAARRSDRLRASRSCWSWGTATTCAGTSRRPARPEPRAEAGDEIQPAATSGGGSAGCCRRLPEWTRRSVDGRAVRPGGDRARVHRARRRELFVGRRRHTSARRRGLRRSRSRCWSRRSRPSSPRSSTACCGCAGDKDTLAMGNMTGAMVFQSSFPVTVGLLFTPWELAARGAGRGVVALARGLRPVPHAAVPRAAVRAAAAAAGRVLRRLRRVRRHEALSRATAGSRWDSAARSSST